MAYCCSQCSFTAQFQSALLMHHQLHHHENSSTTNLQMKLNTVPRVSEKTSLFNIKERGIKMPSRNMSATKLFDKLRARLCRSRTLFPRPEEGHDVLGDKFDISAQSECTSKATREMTPLANVAKDPETFSCHLCSFDADRITVLDRHLLNEHVIGLENLLKLVMAKTKQNLECEKPVQIGRQPYYAESDGEFVIQTVTPKIRILKHAAVNTDLTLTDVNFDCHVFSREIEKMFGDESCDRDELFSKMQTLNEYMCKFVDSSNTLKRALTKEMSQKRLNRTGEPFEMGLGDQESPCWERAHSERLERNRSKHIDTRSDKMKLSSDSFYF